MLSLLLLAAAALRGGLLSNESTGQRKYKVFGTKKEKMTKTRFNKFVGLLDKYGQEAGTGNKRILIPKTLFSKKDLNTLGFIPVTIAIPEAGQTKFESYRNTKNLFHIHEHGPQYTLHEDEHEAGTLTLKKVSEKSGGASFLEKTQALAKGIPHVVTEGIPGAFYYLKGQLTGTEELDERLGDALPQKFFSEVNKIGESSDKPRAGTNLAITVGANFLKKKVQDTASRTQKLKDNAPVGSKGYDESKHPRDENGRWTHK